MRTEIVNKILTEAKRVFGLKDESSEVELHEKMSEAGEDLRADLIVNVANQIALYAAGEIERACDLAVERITSAGLSDQIAAHGDDNDEITGAITQLREEFGKEIAEVKAMLHRAPQADGDGREFNQFDGREKASPIVKPFGAKMQIN